MQTEAATVRKALKEATGAKVAAETKLQEHLDQLEMLTLDKEMAEEHAESMAMEVETLKEKIEELTLDLEVYREGMPLIL